MRLSKPPEPVEVKEQVLRFLERHPELREESAHSVGDVAGYWYGNKLPRYLWKSGWGPALTEAGLDKDRFMRIVGAHRAGFFRWIDGEMSWDELVDIVMRSTAKTAGGMAARARTKA